MFKTHEQHDNPYPTPHAYDGSWLEMLENPNGSLPGRESGSDMEASPHDPGSINTSLGFGPFD
jgi:hypothetical protein